MLSTPETIHDDLAPLFGATILNSNTTVWRVSLTRSRAPALLADIGNLMRPPRLAGSVSATSATLYLAPAALPDAALASLLARYDVRIAVMSAGAIRESTILVGRALWRALRPRMAEELARAVGI